MPTVRTAEPRDVEALMRGTLGNARETEGLELDSAVVRRGVSALLADPHKGLAFVAEAEAGGAPAVVGSLYVTFEWSDWHDAWYWWIQSLYVVPAMRGKGVYSALYAAVKAAARARGDVRSVRLYVEKHNEKGLRAYRGHGMTEAPYVVFEQLL